MSFSPYIYEILADISRVAFFASIWHTVSRKRIIDRYTFFEF